MEFKVISNENILPLSQKEIVKRLKEFIDIEGDKVWIKDDLSLLDENKMTLFQKTIWFIARNFDSLKVNLYHINPKESAKSLHLIEKEIAVKPSDQKEIIFLFQLAVKKFNLLFYPPYNPMTLSIHEALLNNDLSSVIRLVQKNRNCLKQTNSRGETPLHVALRQNNPGISHYLLHELKTADDADEIEGNTPLHLAVLNEDIQSIQMLLDKHSHITLANYQGFTPLDLAKMKKNKAILKLLEEYNAKTLNRFYE